MAQLGNSLYLAEFNSDRIHVYTTDAANTRIVNLANVVSLRALASIGNELVLASKSGLFIAVVANGKLNKIVDEFTSAVATNSRTIYALNPKSGEILVVQRNGDKWDLTKRILLEDFKSKCTNTRRSFYLQVKENHIYVSSWSTQAIQKYNFTGEHVQNLEIGSAHEPLCIAVCATDVDNNLLVSDKKHGLRVLNNSGHWETYTQTVINPTYVVFDGKHTMYALTNTADGRGPNIEFSTCLEVYNLHNINP